MTNTSDGIKSKKEHGEAWTKEDHLINHRLGWFGVFQGFLFASYVALLSAKATIEAYRLSAEIAAKAAIKAACFSQVYGPCETIFYLKDSESSNNSSNEIISKIDQVISHLSWLGFATSVFVALGVLAATWAMDQVYLNEVDETKILKPYGTNNYASHLGQLCAMALPLVSLMFWPLQISKCGWILSLLSFCFFVVVFSFRKLYVRKAVKKNNNIAQKSSRD